MPRTKPTTTDGITDRKRSTFSELRLLVLASLALSVLSYVTNIFLANVMGPETFGKYSYALVLGALFGQFIIFGTVEAGIRHRTTYGEQALSWIFTLKLLNYVVLGVGVCFFGIFNGEIALLLGMIVALNGLSLTTQYEAQGNNVRYMVIYLTERAAITVLIWLGFLVVETGYLLWVFTVLLIGQLGSLVFQYVENRRYRLSFNWRGLFQTYKIGIFILVFELSKFAYGGITRIVIFNKLGDESLGIFATAWQFIPLSTLYFAQTIKSWRLRLTEVLDARDSVSLHRELLGLCAVILLPTSLGSLVLFIEADRIIDLLYTEAYKGAADLMPYLAVYIIVVAFDSIVVMLAIAAGLGRQVGFIYAVFGTITVLVSLFMLDGLGTEAYLTVIILGHLSAVITLSISTQHMIRKLFRER